MSKGTKDHPKGKCDCWITEPAPDHKDKKIAELEQTVSEGAELYYNQERKIEKVILERDVAVSFEVRLRKQLEESEKSWKEEFDTVVGERNKVIAKLDACSEYLKENETPAQCIARNRKDMTNSMKQVAEQMKRAEKAEAQLEDTKTWLEIRDKQLQAALNGEDDAAHN